MSDIIPSKAYLYVALVVAISVLAVVYLIGPLYGAVLAMCLGVWVGLCVRKMHKSHF